MDQQRVLHERRLSTAEVPQLLCQHLHFYRDQSAWLTYLHLICTLLTAVTMEVLTKDLSNPLVIAEPESTSFQLISSNTFSFSKTVFCKGQVESDASHLGHIQVSLPRCNKSAYTHVSQKPNPHRSPYSTTRSQPPRGKTSVAQFEHTLMLSNTDDAKSLQAAVARVSRIRSSVH